MTQLRIKCFIFFLSLWPDELVDQFFFFRLFGHPKIQYTYIHTFDTERFPEYRVTMVGRRMMTAPSFWLQLLFCWCSFLSQAQGFSANIPSSSSSSSESNFHDNPNNSHDHLLTFSPQSFARSQALETAQALDASRFHFSILFVDQDNVLGRLAEGLLERIAEYNDALFQIFPASATLKGGPVDASPPASAISTGQAWGLCETTLTAIGSAFDANECLPQYDLIIATNEQIRAQILQQATPDDTVALQCRTLTDFCQWHDFSSSIGNNTESTGQQQQQSTSPSADTTSPSSHEALLNMLEPDLHDCVAPLIPLLAQHSHEYNSLFHSAAATLECAADNKNNDQTAAMVLLTDQGTVVPNRQSPRVVQAALILATTGITRFCLDAMNVQMEDAFRHMLVTVLKHSNHNNNHNDSNDNTNENHTVLPWKMVEERLTLCNSAVAGYFSPRQRRERYEQYCEELRIGVVSVEENPQQSLHPTTSLDSTSSSSNNSILE